MLLVSVSGVLLMVNFLYSNPSHKYIIYILSSTSRYIDDKGNYIYLLLFVISQFDDQDERMYERRGYERHG